MEQDKDLQRIYDLIEWYDFEELQESEKSFVCRHISEDVYNSMRSTFTDAKELFRNISAPVGREKTNIFYRVARYPVELYKMAAIIVLMTGLGIVLSKSGTTEKKELLAMTDTVYVDRTDTIEIIRETMVYRDLPGEHSIPVDQHVIAPAVSAMETTYRGNDCSTELCPDDMDAFRRTKYKGDFSNDSALADFIVSMQ